MVATLADVAEFFDVAHSTVKTDWRPSGMPGAQGNYDLREIRRWREARSGSQRREDEEKDAASPDAAARALEKLERFDPVEFERHRKLKMENDKELGRLVDRDDVVADAAELVTIIREEIESLPDEVESLLPAEVRHDVKREIDDKIFLKLKRLSNWQPKVKPLDPTATPEEPSP